MHLGFELPHRPLEDILRLVEFRDILRCEQVCKDWRDLIRNQLAPKSITIGLVHPPFAPENVGVGLLH